MNFDSSFNNAGPVFLLRGVSFAGKIRDRPTTLR